MESGAANHICHQCGWSYPNHHPSAKQRRAHKKVCGKKVHESQEHSVEGGCLVDRQVSSKSVEEEYSDAVNEFTDSDLNKNTHQGNVTMDWIVGPKEVESDGLGQKMVRNESGVCFYEDSLQVQEDCAIPSDIDENGKRENILAALKLASVPSEGLPEEMVEGCQENIAGKSSTPPTTEFGVKADLEVCNTTSEYANSVFLSCKVVERDSMPHPEGIHEKESVCCEEVPTGQGTGIFGAKDVSRGLVAHTNPSDAQDLPCDNHIDCSEKLSSVEDVDKTDKLQFVDANGSLGSLHDDRKVDYSNEYPVIGNGAENSTVDESMLSVVNTVLCVPNPSSTEDVDSQDWHSENYVEDSNKCEIMSVETSVSGTDEAGFTSSHSNVEPIKGEMKCDTSLEDEVIQDGAESMASAVKTESYILNSSSNEKSAKIVGLGDENSQDCLFENTIESSKHREIRNTETSVTGTDEVGFVGATDSTKSLQGEIKKEYINESEGIQIVSEKATPLKSMPSAGIETSFSGTDQVVFSGADDGTKPLLEESGSEHSTDAGVIQNGVEKGTAEKLMAPAGVETSLSGTEHAVFSGVDDRTKPLLGEGEIEYKTDTEVVWNVAKNAKSGESLVAAVNSVPCLQNSGAVDDGEEVCSPISEENDKSALEKQLKSMALVILNHTGSQFDSAQDSGGSVSVSTIPTSSTSPSSVLAAETLPGTVSRAQKEETQVPEPISTLSCEGHQLSNTNIPEVASSVLAAETLPGTVSRSQKEETQVPEPVSTLSCEGHQLSNTNIPEVASSMTLDGSSKENDEHHVSEIQAIQNPQQAHASTLKAALDEVVQGRQKNGEIAEKMASRSIRAPLKSFLAEPIFDNRQEATAPGHPELPTYEDGATSKAQATSVPTINGSKKNTDREWDSPARLPKNAQKRRVRWPPFLCCLHVPSDRANLVGAD